MTNQRHLLRDLLRDLMRLQTQLDAWRSRRPGPSTNRDAGAAVEHWLRAQLHDSSDLTIVPVPTQGGTIRLAYLEGLVDLARLDREVIGPLCDGPAAASVWPAARPVPWESLDAGVLTQLAQGSVAIIRPTPRPVLIVDLAKPPHLAVSAAETERTIRGPREGFSEELDTQIAQIRQRIPTADVVVRHHAPEDGVPTPLAVVYRTGLANPAVVREVQRRLQAVRVDAALTSTRVGSIIRDRPWALFPAVRYSERVDLVSQQLDQGKVAILVQGDPFVITVPATLVDFYRTPYDYGTVWYDASFVRLIRLLGAVFGIVLPAIYIALTEVNPDLISPKLFDLVAGSHTGLPFTPLVEVVVMILVIEVLREAALRLPKILATTLGTVGAIVVGTAVVKAGFVSAQIIVLMTFTALSLFSAPTYELVASWRLIGWALLLSSFVLGSTASS